jgi:hypothetical protein
MAATLPSPYYPPASLFAPEKRYGTEVDPWKVELEGQLGSLADDNDDGDPVRLLDLTLGSEASADPDRINPPETDPAPGRTAADQHDELADRDRGAAPRILWRRRQRRSLAVRPRPALQQRAFCFVILTIRRDLAAPGWYKPDRNVNRWIPLTKRTCGGRASR